jgi:transcriptional regulator with XRE-family HTH domain
MKKPTKPRSVQPNINIHIGQKLRTRRTLLGLSQEALGASLNIASQQVQKYEKGANAMNAQRLLEFARQLKVPVSYFFEGLESGARISSLVPLDIADNDGPSDRETIEVLKSFKRLKDYGVRKRIADLLRSLSLKDI